MKVLYQAPDGELYLGLENGYVQRYAGQGKFEVIAQVHAPPADLPAIEAIAQDRAGRLWIGTRGQDGLYSLDLKTRHLRQYRMPLTRYHTADQFTSLACSLAGAAFRDHAFQRPL